MAFAVTEGMVRSLGGSRPAALLNPAQTLSLSDDVAAFTYRAIWRTQPSVRTVVSFLGRNIGQLGLHAYERKSDTQRVRVTDSPLALTLQVPNPWTTPYRWKDELVHDMAIFNRAFYLKMKAEGTLRLVHLRPEDVTPKGNELTGPEYFEVRGQSGTVEIPAESVLYFRGYDPASSPIESLRRGLAEEWAAGVQREQVLRNGARLSGYLERPHDAPKWTDDTRKRFKASWDAQFTGGSASKPGGTPILEDGMTFNSVAQTSEDLQYIEARKLTREEVASAYFIPPPMVGILDHATFSNVKEQHKHLYQDTLGPWLTMIQDELALQLLPAYDGAGAVGTADAAKMYVEFNLEEKLRGSFEEQAVQKQKAVGGPWMTRNEARALDNLAAIEGGDELITPLAVTTGGQANPTDTDTSDEDATDEPPVE